MEIPTIIYSLTHSNFIKEFKFIIVTNSRSRENRSATTFWMDDEVKNVAKQRARDLKITLTDLINKAVAYYIQNISDIEKEYGQRMAMAEITKDFKESQRINTMENNINNVRNKIDELEKKFEQMEMGENLQQTIRAHISARVDPLLERLGELLESLSPEMR